MGYESTEVWLAMKQTKYKRTFEYLHNVLRKTHGDMNEAIKMALNIVCDTVHAEAGTFWFYSKYGDGFIRPRAYYGGKPMEEFFLVPGEGIAGKVVETGDPVYVADCKNDPRWTGRMDEKTGFDTRSMICAPLKNDGRCFGCIQLINKTDEAPFDAKDAELVLALAQEISSDFVSLNLISDGKLEDHVTAMFIDIKGFSAMTMNMEPVEVARLVNSFLAFAIGIIKENEGTPNKYMRDLMLTYWIGEDGPAKACKAAREIINGKDFIREAKEKYGCDLHFGIGISTGPAFVGNIGSSALADFSVFGHTVNEANFIKSNAVRDSIYISSSVVNALGNSIRYHKIPFMSLKHNKMHCEVFALD